MLINCDKFFIQELQNQGYDLDYNKVVEVYKKSRQSDGYKKRQIRKERERIGMAEIEELMLERESRD